MLLSSHLFLWKSCGWETLGSSEPLPLARENMGEWRPIAPNGSLPTTKNHQWSLELVRQVTAVTSALTHSLLEVLDDLPRLPRLWIIGYLPCINWTHGSYMDCMDCAWSMSYHAMEGDFLLKYPIHTWSMRGLSHASMSCTNGLYDTWLIIPIGTQKKIEKVQSYT